jgi:hypothetical protein
VGLDASVQLTYKMLVAIWVSFLNTTDIKCKRKQYVPVQGLVGMLQMLGSEMAWVWLKTNPNVPIPVCSIGHRHGLCDERSDEIRLQHAVEGDEVVPVRYPTQGARLVTADDGLHIWTVGV